MSDTSANEFSLLLSSPVCEILDRAELAMGLGHVSVTKRQIDFGSLNVSVPHRPSYIFKVGTVS